MSRTFKLSQLLPEQRARVDRWIWEENLGETEVCRRCLAEFKLTVDRSAVGRYKRGQERERETEGMVREARESLLAGATVEQEYAAMLNAMQRSALIKLRQPKNAAEEKRGMELARVVIASRRERSQALRARIAQDRFGYDLATLLLKHQIEIAAIADNPELSEDEQIEALRRIAYPMDGPLPPVEAEESSKIQVPNSRETPNIKFQE